jgi:hypothetical protein
MHSTAVLDELQHFDAADIGHHNVQEHKVKRKRLQHGDCRFAIRGSIDIIPFPFQYVGQEVEKSLFVIDSKYGRGWFFHSEYSDSE